MRISLAAAAAPMILLAACATTQGPTAVAPKAAPELAPATADSAYGMFLAGAAALNEGRSAEATRLLEAARVQSGEEPAVAERAFNAALLSGDISKAALLAPTGANASEPGRRMGRLVTAVDLLAQNKGKQARDVLTAEPIGFPHRSAAALLQPWAAAAAGDVEGSLVRPQVRGDNLVDYFGQLSQGLLYERAKRYDEAETDFKAITRGDSPNELAVLTYGGFLERRGRQPDAIALYDQLLKQQPGNLSVQAARARAAKKRSAPPMPSLREGASTGLMVLALTAMEAKQTDIGLAYLRLSLKLDDSRASSWLILGDLLEQSGDTEGARAAYSRARPGSPEFAAAQTKLAWTYQTAGDKETALKLARAAAATGDADARLTLADLLRANERYAESIQILDALIKEAGKDDVRYLYGRGVAYHMSDDWKRAEPDLMAALKLQPTNPELLNYLGYAWIDRGEHLDEAMKMVETAVAAAPRSGAIVDSLGWAHYRLGNYKTAVEKLEQAVELEAGDPEINNHLGDAYWMVGRKDEAQFQWRRVLTLKPDDKIKADVDKKLASGAGPQPTPKLAGP